MNSNQNNSSKDDANKNPQDDYLDKSKGDTKGDNKTGMNDKHNMPPKDDDKEKAQKRI